MAFNPSNPLFAKNLPPIIYEGTLNRGLPAYNIKQSQPQYAQARSMQSFDFNNLLVDVLGKIQKSLDNINTDSNKKTMVNSRSPSITEQNLH